jgi:hypothetical protein
MSLGCGGNERLDAEQENKRILYYAALGTVLAGIVSSAVIGYTCGHKKGKLEMRRSYELNIESRVTSNIDSNLEVR